MYNTDKHRCIRKRQFFKIHTDKIFICVHPEACPLTGICVHLVDIIRGGKR